MTSGDDLPKLIDLAAQVADGRISLTQARDIVSRFDKNTLLLWLSEARFNLTQPREQDIFDLPLRLAFLELGTEAALKAESAFYFLNYGLNLGRLLCREIGEVKRGLELMEQAMQQTLVVGLEPDETVTVILEVADTYLTYHKRMGPDYLKTAAEAYRVSLQLIEGQTWNDQLMARAHLGLGTCLAEEFVSGRMVHASEAITHYEKALEHLNGEADLPLYGLVMHNLGNAHYHCEEGDRTENLQKSVSYFEAALEARRKAGDFDRVRYTCSILAEVEHELEHPMRAVELLEHALETLDPIRERDEYASLHMRLAKHCRQAAGLKLLASKDLTSQAMACFYLVRQMSDPDRETDRWAAATAGWASLHQESGKFEEALDLQDEVINKLNPAEYPYRLAVISLDQVQLLEILVISRIAEGKIDEAKMFREKARRTIGFVRDSDLAPSRKFLAEAESVGIEARLADDAGDRANFFASKLDLLTKALDACTLATPGQELDVIEGRLISALSEIGATVPLLSLIRSRIAREGDFLSAKPSFLEFCNYCSEMRRYWNIAIKTFLKDGDILAAWNDADRARGRSLDLIASAVGDRFDLSIVKEADFYGPSSWRDRHADLVSEWLDNLDEYDLDSGFRRDSLSPWLRQSFRLAAKWRGHWVVDSTLHDNENDLAPLTFADAPTALIELWSDEDSACAFVQMPGSSEIKVVELPYLTTSDQFEWVRQWFQRYGKWEGRGKAAIPAFSRMAQRICLEIGEACWAPLRETLESQPIERVIIIPDSYLNAFPLHAMALPDSKGIKWFCDRYDVAFSPSRRQLNRSLRSRDFVSQTALFIGDPQAECPTGECSGACQMAFPNVEIEMNALRSSWPELLSIVGKDCTPEAALRVLAEVRPGLLHICSHGITRFDDPLGSGLALAYNGAPSNDPMTIYVDHRLGQVWGSNTSGEVLTLDEILRRADLRSCRLVFLNACETGLSYVGLPDEHIGIAAGILAAGVSTVIAPLWPITEAVAVLFARQFYSELRNDPNNKLRALMRTQRWIRDLTHEELIGMASTEQIQAGILLSGRDRPFSHMIFWAPFYLIGSPL